MPSSFGNLAASYSQKLGFFVFPLKQESKVPATKNGLKDASRDLEVIKAWWDENPNYNIALRCGKDSGILVLDVDGESGKKDLEELEFRNGILPSTPIQLTANGKHYLFKYPPNLILGNKTKLIKHEEKGGLDVRAENGYIVLAPSIHPDTKLPYKWLIKPSQVKFSLPPQWLIDLIQTPSQPSINGVQRVFSPPARIKRSTSPEAIIDDQIRMVAHAPEGQRNHTLNVAAMKVGKAIAHADISEATVIENLKHAALQAGLNGHEIDATINSGLKFGKQQPYEYGRNKQISSYNPSETKYDADGVVIENNVVNQKEPNKFKILNFDDLLYAPKVEWIIKGIFPKKSFGVIYGQPGKGKTFVALDMALCIAHGLQWHGLDVVQGSVLYIAGEGMGGLPKRLKAWTSQNARNEPSPPFYAIAAGVNMRDEIDVNSIIASIDGLNQKFSLIVIDTVARAILGGDENSSTDMGLFVAACDAIKEHTGSTVIGIHHSGKDEEKGMRGSSALLGAVDTVVQISQEIEGKIVLKNEKQKDAEPFKDMVFKTAIIATGIDETSIIIEPDEDQTVYQKKVSSKADLYLEKLWDAIADSQERIRGMPAAHINSWRDICYRNELGGDGQEAKKKSFQRARSRLMEQKKIVCENGLVAVIQEDK